MIRPSPIHVLVPVAALALLASPAFAQSAAPGDSSAPAEPAQRGKTNAYDAAFFAQYAPRSALDIANHVPGFTLELGNGDVRGFAGAAGNVVINGARPSSKAESLETTLARIPANRVQRVEIGPGDLYGADYSGKSQVLNIILSAAAGIDGNVTVSGQRIFTGKLVPNASASVLVKRGASSFNLSGGTGRSDYFEEGFDRLTAIPGGEEIEFRRKVNDIRPHDPFVSGSWALEQGDNRSVRLNGRWAPSSFFLRQSNHVTPAGGEQRDDQLVQQYKIPTFELGGDVTRPLADGAIKLVGLATRKKRERHETYLFRADGGAPVLGGFEQFDNSRLDETIGRLSWSRPNLLGMSVELGGEVAYNTLDYSLDFFEISGSGERNRIDLGLDNATVKELRGEAYVKAGKQLSKALRLDLGINYEASQLKVRGDATADRALKFFKPSATLDWNSNGWHAQASLRRTVSQLDFYDFVSVAELSTSRVNGGNANLQPQRSWEARLLGEHPLWGDGKVRVELGYDRVSLLQDRILVFDEEGNAFDAPGNIGTGTRRFVTVELDAPLARFGLTGTRLKGNVTLQKTRVEDPIFGTPRRWSGFYPWFNWYAELRRDKGKWAYGIAVSDRSKFTFFRTDEFDSNVNKYVYSTAFVEYRPADRTTVTLDINNLFDTAAQRQRLFFRPNRLNPNPVSQEVRERNIHLMFQLTLKQTFGSGAKK